MRAALVTAMMAAVVFCAGAPASEAQPQPPPRPRSEGVGDRVGTRPDQPVQPRRPVRDPRQPRAEGTATVRGRVVDAATGLPIARAAVRIQGRGGRDEKSTRTDAEGNFALTRLPAGQLFIRVEKATYLIATYPERRRTMRPSNVMLTDGQTVDNITIPMSRGGAITGRVIDAYGDPVEHVIVHAFSASPSVRGMPDRGMRAAQATNDIGEYRISRLEPGQYFLLAMPQRGRGTAEDSSSANGRTFYPGVAAVEQAQPITIERGQSVAGIDLQLLETTLTKVTGVVLTAKGTPAARGGHVTVRQAAAGKNPTTPDPGSGTGIDQNGTFELTLQPGDYIIEAMASQNDQSLQMRGFEMDRGQIRLQVAGEAISGVTISTGPGGTASGRFVFNGRSAPPATGFKGLNVGISGANEIIGDQCRTHNNRPTVNADGTFTIENIWGTCLIRGSGMVQGWTFEAVMHNGNNITSRPIEFDAGRSIRDVEIVFTDRVGDLSVTVSDERGTPTEDYISVLFPAEKEKWGDSRFLRAQVHSAVANPEAAGGSNAGRVMSNSVNPASFALGSVTGGAQGPMRGLLAGDYFVIALEDVAYDDLREPEFLERLSQEATRVTVPAGGAESVQLRRIKLPSSQPE